MKKIIFVLVASFIFIFIQNANSYTPSHIPIYRIYKSKSGRYVIAPYRKCYFGNYLYILKAIKTRKHFSGALNYAIDWGFYRYTKILLKEGANPSNRYWPLEHAIKYTQIRIIKLLVKWGANSGEIYVVNKGTKYERRFTPLITAVSGIGDNAMMQKQTNYTPAYRAKKVAIIKYLLEDKDTFKNTVFSNINGKTVLMYAAENPAISLYGLSLIYRTFPNSINATTKQGLNAMDYMAIRTSEHLNSYSKVFVKKMLFLLQHGAFEYIRPDNNSFFGGPDLTIVSILNTPQIPYRYMKRFIVSNIINNSVQAAAISQPWFSLPMTGNNYIIRDNFYDMVLNLNNTVFKNSKSARLFADVISHAAIDRSVARFIYSHSHNGVMSLTGVFTKGVFTGTVNIGSASIMRAGM
ncbi:MAG: hypothetical protein ACYCS0_00970 [bacterium]